MKSSQGFSLLELLVVLTLASVLMAMATLNMRRLVDPAITASAELTGHFKKIRAKALTTTRAYTIVALNNRKVIARYSDSCSTPTASQVEENSLAYTLPTGASLGNTNWTVCYTSRGLSNLSANIVVNDDTGHGSASRTVQVVMGGGVRVT